jgi:hypothetical protein
VILLAEYDEEEDTNTQEDENTTNASDYTSQPDGHTTAAIGRARRVPTSLQEALQLLSSYKLLPTQVDADPAGGQLHRV